MTEEVINRGVKIQEFCDTHKKLVKTQKMTPEEFFNSLPDEEQAESYIWLSGDLTVETLKKLRRAMLKDMTDEELKELAIRQIERYYERIDSIREISKSEEHKYDFKFNLNEFINDGDSANGFIKRMMLAVIENMTDEDLENERKKDSLLIASLGNILRRLSFRDWSKLEEIIQQFGLSEGNSLKNAEKIILTGDIHELKNILLKVFELIDGNAFNCGEFYRGGECVSNFLIKHLKLQRERKLVLCEKLALSGNLRNQQEELTELICDENTKDEDMELLYRESDHQLLTRSKTSVKIIEKIRGDFPEEFKKKTEELKNEEIKRLQEELKEQIKSAVSESLSNGNVRETIELIFDSYNKFKFLSPEEINSEIFDGLLVNTDLLKSKIDIVLTAILNNENIDPEDFNKRILPEVSLSEEVLKVVVDNSNGKNVEILKLIIEQFLVKAGQNTKYLLKIASDLLLKETNPKLLEFVLSYNYVKGKTIFELVQDNAKYCDKKNLETMINSLRQLENKDFYTKLSEIFTSRNSVSTSDIDSYAKSKFESFDKEKEGIAELLSRIVALPSDQIEDKLNHLLPIVVDRASLALNNVDNVNSKPIVSFFEPILRDDFSGNILFTNYLRNKLFCLIIEKFDYHVHNRLLSVFLEVIEKPIITEMFPKIKENKELSNDEKCYKLQYLVRLLTTKTLMVSPNKVNNFFACLESCLKETDRFLTQTCFTAAFSGLVDYCSLNKSESNKSTTLSIISQILTNSMLADKEWFIEIPFEEVLLGKDERFKDARKKLELSDDVLMQLIVENSGEKNPRMLKAVFDTLFPSVLERPKAGVTDEEQKEFEERLSFREEKLLLLVKSILGSENYNFEFLRSIIDSEYVGPYRDSYGQCHSENFEMVIDREVFGLILKNIDNFEETEILKIIELTKKVAYTNKLYTMLYEKISKSEKWSNNALIFAKFFEQTKNIDGKLVDLALNKEFISFMLDRYDAKTVLLQIKNSTHDRQLMKDRLDFSFQIVIEKGKNYGCGEIFNFFNSLLLEGNFLGDTFLMNSLINQAFCSIVTQNFQPDIHHGFINLFGKIIDAIEFETIKEMFSKIKQIKEKSKSEYKGYLLHNLITYFVAKSMILNKSDLQKIINSCFEETEGYTSQYSTISDNIFLGLVKYCDSENTTLDESIILLILKDQRLDIEVFNKYFLSENGRKYLPFKNDDELLEFVIKHSNELNFEISKKIFVGLIPVAVTNDNPGYGCSKEYRSKLTENLSKAKERWLCIAKKIAKQEDFNPRLFEIFMQREFVKARENCCGGSCPESADEKKKRKVSRLILDKADTFNSSELLNIVNSVEKVLKGDRELLSALKKGYSDALEREQLEQLRQQQQEKLGGATNALADILRKGTSTLTPEQLADLESALDILGRFVDKSADKTADGCVMKG